MLELCLSNSQSSPFRVLSPGQQLLNSKVYDFYKQYQVLTKEKDNGLITVDEYLQRCESLNEIHKESIFEEMESSYDLGGYNKVGISFIVQFLKNILSQKRIGKASFLTPILNIKPKSHQNKRALPRTILKAVKKSKNENAYQLNKRKMRAYREALAMLDNIKRSTENKVMVNGSSLEDKLETSIADNPQKDQESKSKCVNSLIEEDMTDRSEK